MAVIIGLGTRELAAEPKPRPKAADLTLGVRERSFKLLAEDLCDSDKVAGLDESRDAAALCVGYSLSTMGDRLENGVKLAPVGTANSDARPREGDLRENWSSKPESTRCGVDSPEGTVTVCEKGETGIDGASLCC